MSDNEKHIGVLTESAMRECKTELARVTAERDAHRTQCVEYAKLSPEQAAEVEYLLGVTWMRRAEDASEALRECEEKLACVTAERDALEANHGRAHSEVLRDLARVTAERDAQVNAVESTLGRAAFVEREGREALCKELVAHAATQQTLRECEAKLAVAREAEDRLDVLQTATRKALTRAGIPDVIGTVPAHCAVQTPERAAMLGTKLSECEAMLASAELERDIARESLRARNAELDGAEEALGRETRERSAAERKLKRLEQAAREACDRLKAGNGKWEGRQGYSCNADDMKFAVDTLERALALASAPQSLENWRDQEDPVPAAPVIVDGPVVRPQPVSEEFCRALENAGARDELVSALREERDPQPAARDSEREHAHEQADSWLSARISWYDPMELGWRDICRHLTDLLLRERAAVRAEMQVEINMHRAAIALHDRAVDAAIKAERERVLALYPKNMAQHCYYYVVEWRRRIESGEKP